jgi:hypothetical protein
VAARRISSSRHDVPIRRGDWRTSIIMMILNSSHAEQVARGLGRVTGSPARSWSHLILPLPPGHQPAPVVFRWWSFLRACPCRPPFRAFRSRGSREGAASRGVWPPRSAWSRAARPTTYRRDGHDPFSAVPGVRRTTFLLGPRAPASTPGSVRMGRIQGVPGTPRSDDSRVPAGRMGGCTTQTGRARTCCLESCLGRGCNAMLRGSFEADDGLLAWVRT